MALTVAQAMTLPGMRMRLLAGRAGLSRVVRWAHVSELADPVPWLRGGELVMTIGLGLPGDPAGLQAYVERLSGAGCAGLAFALGEAVTAVPEEVLAAADLQGLPVLEILTPFIAVTEAVARWHADERVRGERRVVAAQEAMARAALLSGTSGILRALAEHTGGESLLLDPQGKPRAATPPGERPWHARALEMARGAARLSAGVLDDGIQAVQVQSLGFSGPPTGWLAVCTGSPLEWHARMLANQAACLLAMELLGVRAGRAKAQAQRGALLAAVLDGGLSPRQLGELCPVAAPPYEVVVTAAPVPPEAAIEALEEVAADAEELALVCVRPEGTVFVLPERTAPVSPGGRSAVPWRGTELCTRLGVPGGGCRALGLDELPSAVRHAATLAARGDAYLHVDDLEASALLRDAFVPDAAHRFAAAALRPLREYEARHGGDLVGSLRAYLEAGSNLETAARRLGVHRNTLRRRLAVAERVSGRPFTDPGHRLQLWLALSLGDLVPPG